MPPLLFQDGRKAFELAATSEIEEMVKQVGSSWPTYDACFTLILLTLSCCSIPLLNIKAITLLAQTGSRKPKAKRKFPDLEMNPI